MTIENFSLELHSERTQTTTVSQGFLTELDAQQSKRLEEMEAAVTKEMELFRELEYALIRQLLGALQSQPYKQHTCHDLSLEQQPYSVYEERRETESLSVSMVGEIRTATQAISIDMNLFFSSSFVERYAVERSQFYDPLVLNFDGTLPNLENTTFSFDLDCDGVNEQVAPLQERSGFLALDSNNNGIIDDGSELFGATNGNGFADLSRYDSDNNRWIDANDSVFDDLRIWSHSEEERRLIPLKELGIGALYLGYTKNSFDLRNDDGDTLGRIRSNGLYLNEDGSSGLMTQIDLANRHKHAGRKMEPSDLHRILKAM